MLSKFKAIHSLLLLFGAIALLGRIAAPSHAQTTTIALDFAFPFDNPTRIIDYNIHPFFSKDSCYGVDIKKTWHAGEDWFTTENTPVKAVANGTVMYVHPIERDYPGSVVVIKHVLPDGRNVFSMYGHLNEPPPVTVNQVVKKGDEIGSVLFQPNNTHLHWEIRDFYDGSSLCNNGLVPGPGYTYPDRPDTQGYYDPFDYIDQHSSTHITLFADTFGAGNLTNWTVVDAPGATSSPSNWAVVNAHGSLALRQSSNIHVNEAPFEGTYVYSGNDWWTDYYFNLDFNPQDNDGVFVLFRYQNNDNYYRFFLDRERNFRRLEKKINGVFQTLAEDLSNGYNTDGWINIKIIVKADRISVFLDHASVFDVVDNSIPSGSIGLGTWACANCYFDNVLVTTSDIDPFADAVAESNIKVSGNQHRDPWQAVGRPKNNDDYDFVSIGGPGYWLTLDMGEGEEIHDRPGNDFRIYEVGQILGGIDEEYQVSVSNATTGPWFLIGQGMSTSEFDLAKVGMENARYIKIEDLSTRTGSPVPGSDIFGVQGFDIIPALSIRAPEGVSRTIEGNNVIVSWDFVRNAKEYVIYASRFSNGTGFRLLGRVSADSIQATSSLQSNTRGTYTHINAANSNLYYVVTTVAHQGYESGFSNQSPQKVFLPLIKR